MEMPVQVETCACAPGDLVSGDLTHLLKSEYYLQFTVKAVFWVLSAFLLEIAVAPLYFDLKSEQ